MFMIEKVHGIKDDGWVNEVCLGDNDAVLSEGEAGHTGGAWDFDKDVLQSEYYKTDRKGK